MSLPKQRLGDDLSASVPAYNLIHHNSSRITRFLLYYCVSIFQGHHWRFTLFILVWFVTIFSQILCQHLRWPMWSSACCVVWEATESSRFLQLIRLQDGNAESLLMRIRLMGSGGMLSITFCYYCHLLPSKTKVSEPNSLYLKTHFWWQFLGLTIVQSWSGVL